MKVYQDKNNLTYLHIHRADLTMRNGGDILANTLRSYTNLKILELEESEITDEHLVPIVEAIRDHRIPDPAH